ncbi:MAG: LysM peptidoglycan-binding domain-containing protein [Caldilineaceae bacterium]
MTVKFNLQTLLYRTILIAFLTLPVLILAASPVQAAPVAQEVVAANLYVVQRGDTLSAIAQQYGTTVEVLMRNNHLQSTTIYVGQQLKISAGGSDPIYPITYVVQRGDTLYKIARRYDTTVAALMTVNHLASDRIYVGQPLTISVAADPTMPVTEYIVQRGDTLSAIAQRFAVSVASIRATNGLTSNRIYVGQRLLIPTSLGYPTPAPAPEREEIHFAPGTTSATVTGTVADPAHRVYMVRAEAGQTMQVELTSASNLANFSVRGLEDGQVLKDYGATAWQGVLPKTQAYLIEILTMEFSTSNYSLFIEIPPLSHSGTAERVQFQPGASGAKLHSYTSKIEPKRYLVWARQGQQMTLDLMVDNTNAYLTLLAPNGSNLAATDGAIHNWSGALPATGDYVIKVLNPGTGLANFDLQLTIQ